MSPPYMDHLHTTATITDHSESEPKYYFPWILKIFLTHCNRWHDNLCHSFLAQTQYFHHKIRFQISFWRSRKHQRELNSDFFGHQRSERSGGWWRWDAWETWRWMKHDLCCVLVNITQSLQFTLKKIIFNNLEKLHWLHNIESYPFLLSVNCSFALNHSFIIDVSRSLMMVFTVFSKLISPTPHETLVVWYHGHGGARSVGHTQLNSPRKRNKSWLAHWGGWSWYWADTKPLQMTKN